MKEKCDNFIEESKLNFVLFESTNKQILEYFRGLEYLVTVNLDKNVSLHFVNIPEEFTPYINFREWGLKKGTE